MIIDLHNHVGNDKDGNAQTIEELGKSMAAYGIDKAAIFPFDESGKELVRASLDLLEYKSEKILPFLRFDPKNVKPDQISKIISGFYGVKLHPRSQSFDPLDKRFYPIYAEIEKAGKPLMIHTRKENNPNTDPDRVVTLASSFPKLNIIIAHFAGASREAIEYIGEHDNLYLETSVFSSTKPIESVLKRIGSEKIVFGSDSPYSDQEIELMKVKKANISERDRNRILHENAELLLGL